MLRFFVAMARLDLSSFNQIEKDLEDYFGHKEIDLYLDVDSVIIDAELEDLNQISDPA